MTYELAKELKDAGFPFKTTNFGANEHIKHAFFLDEPYGLGYIPPTLSELIEACGDGFKKLWRHSNGKWTAHSGTKTQANSFQKGGETAETAVAKLWLALNKK
jgi:hypothetical protein